MQKWRMSRYFTTMLIAMVITLGGAGTVAAVSSTSNSTHYQASQMQFGAGSTKEQCSGQYCARASIGDTSAGDTFGATSTAKFGSITDSDPLLEVIVDPGVSNLGILDTEHTASKTTLVKVRNYLSSGYVLQITGTPPKYANHVMATPSTPTASSPGTEQFGINATVNTVPAIGAAPVQVPSGHFSFGAVNDDYKTANLFKYASGDVVAHSDTESGETDYTISMIVNISNATPAGHFVGEFSAVVIPVY